MPTVPNVEGQPKLKRELIAPAPNHPISGEPIHEEVAKPNIPEPTPEPAKTAVDFKPPTQDELAQKGIASHNVKTKEMVPGESPAKPDPTAEERSEKARKAIEARWSKRYDWENAPIDHALEYLAEIRAEVEKGGLVLQRRISVLKIERVKCFGCTNEINLSEGRYAGMRTRNNWDTGLPESAYACSAACYIKLCRDFEHPRLVKGV